MLADAGEVLADGGLQEEADECFDMAMVSTVAGVASFSKASSYL